MKISIIHISHDGVHTHHCGVGTMVSEYISASFMISRFLISKGIEVAVYCMSPQYNKRISSFSDIYYKKNKSICDRSNGKIILLDYDTEYERYPPQSTWRQLSEAAVKHVNEIASSYDRCLVFYNDAPFCFSMAMDHRKNIRKIWVPHSTSKTNLLQELNPLQLKYEEEIIAGLNHAKNAQVCCIGRYMLDHLVNDYNLSTKKAVIIENGFATLPKYKKEKYRAIKPINSLSVSGRTVSYKNILSVVEAFLCLQKNNSRLRLIMSVPVDAYESNNCERLRNIVKANKNILWHKEFVSSLNKKIYRSKESMLSISLSLTEPFGLMPMELRRYSLVPHVLVVPNMGGMSCQVDHKVDGIKVQQMEPNHIVDTLEYALNMQDDEIFSMWCKGKERLIERHDMYKNLLGYFMSDFLIS